MTNRNSALLLTLFVVLAGSGSARQAAGQGDEVPIGRPDAALRALGGVEASPAPLPFLANSHLLGGSPVSVGLGWMATYDEGGMTFVPALGERAPVTRRLNFRLAGVEVGGRALGGLDLGAPPKLVGDTVTYARGTGLTELYDAVQEGLEQSFVLEALPGRDGDLVVRGQLTTDLEAAGVALDGSAVRFREPDLAELRIDTVVAIDADGDRVPGSLRYDGDVIEIVVPASFVATADLPLLIDPLFGVLHDGTDGSVSADQVDVAYGDSINDEYALTFRQTFSAVTSGIWAATFTNDGAPGLTLFSLSTLGTFLEREPAIAYNLPQSQFAVAWERTPAFGGSVDVVMTTFDAGSGAVESAINIATGLSTPRLPDIGGEESQGPYDRVVVVYEAAGTIRAASVAATDGATPAVLSDVPIPTMVGGYGRPAITKSGGAPGRYFVAAESDPAGTQEIAIAVVSYTGSVQPGSATITPAVSFQDYLQPDIAGDGASCLVVYQSEFSSTAQSADIRGRKLTYDGFNLIFDPTPVSVIFGPGDQIEPAVGLSGNEYIVAWANAGSTGPNGIRYDIAARTIGVDTCLPCEPGQLLGPLIGTSREPEIGARAAGGETGAEEAAIAFAVDFNPETNNQIRFHLWQNDSGGTVEVNAGGGCGNGGTFSLSGSRSIGSDDLLARLIGADPLATVAILNVNVPGGDIPCAACSILPPFLLFSVPTTPGAFGTKNAQVPLAIPCDIRLAGETLAFQWWVLPTSVSPCVSFPTISASDQIWLTLGY